MGKGLWRNETLRQAAAGLGYASAFLALQPVSDAHWHLHAALRLTCLLLVPYRYWLALAVGEAIPNAYTAYQCLDSFGANWVALRSIPPMVLAMPLVWLCRSRLNLFPSKRLVNIKTLVQCILMVSTTWAAYSYAAVSMVRVPDGSFHAHPAMAAGYLIGNYVTLLSIVPWALIVRLDYRKGQLHNLLKRVTNSKLIPDAVCLFVPALLLLAWMSLKTDATQRQIIEMAMFVPVAWLTLKHGWRAAALGGTVAITCTALLHADTPDPALIETQLFLGLTITGLYAMGARISTQLAHEENERLATLGVQRAERQTLQLSERRLRQAAERLEFVAGTLHITNGRFLEHMRRVMPNIENHAFYKQAVAAQQQVYELAESLHPVAWRDRGLPAALHETVARALDEAGIAYSCEIRGRGFSALEPAVLTAAYRTACEAIVYVCAKLTCSHVRLAIRAGATHGHHWVVVRIEGRYSESDDGIAHALYRSEHRRDLGAKLGTNTRDINEMRSHVEIFNGCLHIVPSEACTRVTALLHSGATQVRKQETAAPMRLWVS
jgi:hypothetical protein